MSATNDKGWFAWEAELHETFRKWWLTARDYQVITTWTRDAAGRRRAMRATSDVAERRVTLRFRYRGSTLGEWREIGIAAEKRERAVDNLAALARACEWLRMSEVREIDGIVAILFRQMHPHPSGQSSQSSQQQSQQQTPPPRSSGPYATLHLTNDAPLAVAEAAYRAAARDYHAEANHGNPNGTEALRQMQALNAAIAAIRLERAAEYANRK